MAREQATILGLAWVEDPGLTKELSSPGGTTTIVKRPAGFRWAIDARTTSGKRVRLTTRFDKVEAAGEVASRFPVGSLVPVRWDQVERRLVLAASNARPETVERQVPADEVPPSRLVKIEGLEKLVEK